MALPHLELDDGESTLCEYVTISGTKYRIPIFKLAVGPAGTYVGDASAGTPLPTSGGGGGGTVDQGAAGTAAAGWFIKITNGTDIALVTASGALSVDGSAVTQPVSGSITTAASASVTGTDTDFQAALLATVVAVKASSGRLYSFYAENPNVTKSYIQMFDLATGGVILGTTTPKLSFFIPPSGAAEFYMTVPATFGTAISIAATTTATGSTPPGTGLIVNTFYK